MLGMIVKVFEKADRNITSDEVEKPFKKLKT